MNFVRIKEASKIIGLTVGTLYVYSTNDRKNNITNRFLTKGGKVYVNIDSITKSKVTQKTQLEFERLYFILEERHKRKSHLFEKIAHEIGFNKQRVASYFLTNFLSGRETMKCKYINAMQNILDKG